MKYVDLSREHRALKKIPYNEEDTTRNDVYWTAHQGFKIQLQHAMCDEESLRTYSRAQLLKVIAWCSTFRPEPPHSILSRLARLSEKVEDK